MLLVEGVQKLTIEHALVLIEKQLKNLIVITNHAVTHVSQRLKIANLTLFAIRSGENGQNGPNSAPYHAELGKQLELEYAAMMMNVHLTTMNVVEISKVNVIFFLYFHKNNIFSRTLKGTILYRIVLLLQ